MQEKIRLTRRKWSMAEQKIKDHNKKATDIVTETNKAKRFQVRLGKYSAGWRNHGLLFFVPRFVARVSRR